MISYLWPRAADIATWARRAEAKPAFPRLIRALLHETATATSLEFPAGEAIYRPGWDGRAEIVSRRWSKIPIGDTGWELGTTEDPAHKALEDWKARTENDAGVVRANTVFVFVTGQIWNGEPWAKKHRKLGIWADVRVLDATAIEEWLGFAPQTRLWLSEQIHGALPGLGTLATRWSEWSKCTSPAIPASLLLAGRSKEAEQVRDWSRTPSQAYILKADSPEEATAFIAAALERDDPSNSDDELFRVALVSDLSSWRLVAGSQPSLILVPEIDCLPIATATSGGHTVFVPRGGEEKKADLELPRLDVDEAARALEGIGVPQEKARAWAVAARRNLQSFRREHAVHGQTFAKPGWAHEGPARRLLSAVFAGGWLGHSETDQRALSLLAGGVPYAELSATFEEWSRSSDPPLRFADGPYYLTSKRDAWTQLREFVTTDDLVRLRYAAVEAIAAPDPLWHPGEDRSSLSAIREDSRVEHPSDGLRNGLADTLAMLAAIETWSGAPFAAATRTAEAAVADIMKAVRADATGAVWASVGPVLPELAEAAPREVLDAIESALSAEGLLSRLLYDEKTKADVARHRLVHGIVDALEVLAWSPEFLPRATEALGLFSRQLPAVANQQNPALAALTHMFMPWLPQTGGGLEDRLRAIDSLRAGKPDVAWELLTKLLPQPFGMSGYTRGPAWREWRNEGRLGVTVADYAATANLVVMRAVDDAGTSGHRWAELVEAYARLPKHSREVVLDRLKTMDVERLADEDREAIRRELRAEAGRHRQFAKADWAMPSDAIAELEAVSERFEPRILAIRHRWLFEQWVEPFLVGARRPEAEGKTMAARVAAIKEIAAAEGEAGIASLVDAANFPWHVGWALGRAARVKPLQGAVLRWADDPSPKRRQAADGLFTSIAADKGLVWAEATLAGKRWPAGVKARLLQPLRPGAELWQLVTRLGADVDLEYWRQATWLPAAKEDVPHAFTKLLDVGRPRAAIDIVSTHLELDDETEVGTELAMQALRAAAGPASQWDARIRLDDYQLNKLVQRLEEANPAGLAELEWECLGLLDPDDVDLGALDRKLAADPAFFVELLSLAFRSEGEPARELRDDELTRATSAFRVLHAWHLPPGLIDGAMDRAALSAWVDAVRALAKSAGRLAIADTFIGHVLRYAPPGTDGVWPHEAVRDLVDRVETDDVARGIGTELINSRGVVTRSIKEGGRQDRELAEHYRGNARALGSWRRLPKVLDDLADMYSSEAKREDAESARLEDAV